MTRNLDEPISVPAAFGGAPVRPPERRLIFGEPIIGDAEVASVIDCLRSGWIGVGPRVERFQREFACYKRIPHAVAVSSGTAALHLALVALGIGRGAEVIAPTMTFCSTIHSIVHVGATPVLTDCRLDNFNIDPEAIEQRITPRTRAILVVHMCGRCCDMDRILKIAQRHRLLVIEDCAHAIESEYDGQPAGTMGDAGCFSFYPTKNATTGDGGMVITRDSELARKVKLLSLHGLDTDAWTRFSGGPASYQVVEAGFKYNMTDISASLGLPQLAAIDERWHARKKIWRQYDELLQPLPLALPSPVQPNTRHAYHLYTILLDLEAVGATRDEIIEDLRMENIGAGIHYVPVHMQPFYRMHFGFSEADFPNATFVGNRTVSLPISAKLSGDDVADVCRALARILRYYTAQSANGGQRHSRAAVGTSH